MESTTSFSPSLSSKPPSSPFNQETLRVFEAISLASSALLALCIGLQLRAEFSKNRRLLLFLGGRNATAVFFFCTIVQAVFLEVQRSELPIAWDGFGGGSTGNRTSTSCNEASLDKAAVHILTMLAPSPFLFAPEVWKRIIPSSAAICGFWGLVILAKHGAQRLDQLTLRFATVVAGFTVFHHIIIAVSLSRQHVLFSSLGLICTQALNVRFSAVRDVIAAIYLPDVAFCPHGRWRRLAAGMPAYPRLFAVSHALGMVWVCVAAGVAMLPAWSGDWAASGFSPLGCVLLAIVILELYVQAVSETQVLAVSQSCRTRRTAHGDAVIRMSLRRKDGENCPDLTTNSERLPLEINSLGGDLQADVQFLDKGSDDKVSAFHCHLLNDSSLQPITPLLLFFSFLLFALTAVFARASIEGALNPDGAFAGRWRHFPYLYAWLCMGVAACILPRYAALQVCFSRGYAHAPLLQRAEYFRAMIADVGLQVIEAACSSSRVGNLSVTEVDTPRKGMLYEIARDQLPSSDKNLKDRLRRSTRLVFSKASSWKGRQLMAAINFTLSAVFFVYLIGSGHVSNAPDQTSGSAFANCALLDCGKCHANAETVSTGSIGCGWCALAGGSGLCLNGKQLPSGHEMPVATDLDTEIPKCLAFNMTAAADSHWCAVISCESMQNCKNCSARSDCGWCSQGQATGCHTVDTLQDICPGNAVASVKECGLTFCSERSSLKECVDGPSPDGLCGWCSEFQQCRLASADNPYRSAGGHCQAQLSNWDIVVPTGLPNWNADDDGSDLQKFVFFQDPCWPIGETCEACVNQTSLLDGAYPCVWCPTMKRCISSSYNTSSGLNITDAPSWAVQQTQLCTGLHAYNSNQVLVGKGDACVSHALSSDPAAHCMQHLDCISCNSDSLCGWCGKGKGTCVAYGNSTSSLDGSCRDGPWWMPQVRACTAQPLGYSGCSQQASCFACITYGWYECDWCEASASCQPSGSCDTSKAVVSESTGTCRLSSSNCTTLSRCLDCAATYNCGWDQKSGTCGDTSNFIADPASCPNAQSSKCYEAKEKGCNECLAIDGCGFCVWAGSEDEEFGICLEGDSNGAFDSSCSYGRWSFGDPQVCNVNYFPYEVSKSSTPDWIRTQAANAPFSDDPESMQGRHSAAVECSLRQSCSFCVSEGCEWCASRELGTGFGGFCSPRSSSRPSLESNCTWSFGTCPVVEGVTRSCELCIESNPTNTFASVQTAIELNSSWLAPAEQKWGVVPNLSVFNYSKGHSGVYITYLSEWCSSSGTCPTEVQVAALDWTDKTVKCDSEMLIPNGFSSVACTDPCYNQRTCDECTVLPYCGWCQNSQSADGGNCFMANVTDSLPLKSWCPAKNWVKAGDLSVCSALRASVKEASNVLFATSCLEELTMATAACCVAIIGLVGIAWTLVVQKHPGWKVGWLPTDDLFRLGTLVKAYLAAVKALLLGQMLTSSRYSSSRSETIILLVLFLASFLAVFWITFVDVRRLWSTVRMWQHGAPFSITSRHPRLFVFSYGFLFLWVKVTLLLIGVGGHLSTQIVATARFLVASASVGVVVNNEIAQRLRMAIVATTTEATLTELSSVINGVEAARSSPARSGISIQGLSSLVPVAIAIGTAGCCYLAIAGSIILQYGEEQSTSGLSLAHVAIGLSAWEGLYVCGLIVLLWSYYEPKKHQSGRRV